jgi:hypothetical protein
MNESIVFCEGFHDRAFWKGWLQDRFRCTDPGAPQPGQSQRRQIIDPFNEKVRGGQFAYHTPAGHFLRVIPCHGDQNAILTALRVRLKDRSTKPVLRLALNVDSDLSVAAPTGRTRLQIQDLEPVLRPFDPHATLNADGDWELFGGASKVSLIRWETHDPAHPHLPDQQCLERLICAAIIAAYPDRAAVVRQWLDGRPQPPPLLTAKEFSWSHMAGWYAENGCDDFFTHLWRDPRLVTELGTRLKQSGAWRVAEVLVS